MHLSGAVWRTSTRSSNNERVEVADNLPGALGVRDSKEPSGAVLVFAPAAWRAFVAVARRPTA
ncbi:DUF397 domain-containing protein [Micromonospora sp. NBC_01638]|uniref:DUF397 domain-containing protein n=1 Tax=Micromonospora sp. NBC_01638 TaxID=2975982 RepID=UPI00386B290A|nr:DUF397 domain-containing protein [Micromonospora sp. NBC_01638]